MTEETPPEDSVPLTAKELVRLLSAVYGRISIQREFMLRLAETLDLPSKKALVESMYHLQAMHPHNPNSSGAPLEDGGREELREIISRLEEIVRK